MVADLQPYQKFMEEIICVLHADGAVVRVWDILTCSSVLCQSIAAKTVRVIYLC